jgi:hypothetical protein
VLDCIDTLSREVRKTWADSFKERRREQTAAEPWRGRSDTPMLLLSGLNRACW